MKIIVLFFSLFAGCAAIEGWMAGTITEGIPKMREKLPRTVKIHFANPVNARGYRLHERSEKQVQDAFGGAFDVLKVEHSVRTNGCSHVLHVVVDSWQYGDGGLLGSGDRDSVSMSVMLQDIATDRVLTRATLYARNIDPLVRKYVKTLFKDE